MLSIRNLQLELNEQRLFEPVNFDLAPGACLQLCGPNGVGKTSILKILAGLLKPRRGSILWQGKKLLSLSQEAKYLGHDLALKLSLTLEENLKYYASIMQTNPAEIHIACDFFQLLSLLSLPVQQLSAGQKHRAQLAKLLINRKPIWLLDEPFTGLDQTHIQQLLRLFKIFLEKDGMIIFTSHHPIDVDTFSIQRLELTRATHETF
ncbi:MAG: ccmA [Gammaproteobacteria bacterium]|jgi:heme exporter protein A|nr:ccmA [Gammaproteobacteria bacterium]